jgi:hypothetical protein
VTDDFIIQSGGTVFPVGVLNIGGSFDNNAFFSPNGGTVRFNATNSSETIAAGQSSFNNLTIDGVGGTFTVVEAATTTGTVLLQNATSFTVNPGVVFDVAGTLNHQLPAANTTWTGSTLVFSGNDHTINQKTHGGDTFDTVLTKGDTDIAMWNSSASAYAMNDTGSVYSMDHAAGNGALNIYGDYRRATSTEYWNYARDFDGADLTGGNERQVTVSVASSSQVRIATRHEVVGAPAASTSVNAISGTFTLLSNGATIDAEYFTVTGTNNLGWQLTNATLMETFTNGRFVIASNTAALSVGADTIDANPAAQFFNLRFETTAATATNVTLTSIPSSYWWFRDGSGNRYGEAFDDDNGDPGSIQWDDSQFSVVIAGTVYADDGVTRAGAALCDGLSPVVSVVVDGTVATTTVCSPVDGSYQATVSFSGDPEIMAYLNNSAAGASPSQVTLETATSGQAVIPGTAQFTFTRPTVSDGDLLVLILGKDDEFGVVASDEWTLLAQRGDVGNDEIYSSVWYRPVVDAEQEPADYVFTGLDTGEGYSYWMGVFNGVDLGRPFENAPTWSKLLNDVTPEATGTTTLTDGSYALAAWVVDAEADVSMPGGSFTTLAEDVVSATDQINLSVAGRVVSPAGASGNPEIGAVTAGRDPQTIQLILRRATYGPTQPAATVTKTPIVSSRLYQPNPITLVASTSAQISQVTGNIPVRRPAVQNGDVLIAYLGKDDDLAITPPSGWTEISALGSTGLGSDLFSGVWYKVVTNAAAEPAYYDFVNTDGTEGLSYFVGAFRGVDPVAPIDVAGTWTALQNDDAPTAPGITTVTDDALVLALWYVDADATVTMPGGAWSTIRNNLFNENNLNLASRLYASAGTTDDVDVTGMAATTETHVMQLALRPIGYGVPDRISNFDLYANRVIVRAENDTPLTILEMLQYDSDQDPDVPFTAIDAAPDTLTVTPGAGLFVWGGEAFAPGGDVTLSGGAGQNGRDGSLRVGPAGAFTAAGSQSHSFGGSLYLDAGAVLTPASSFVTFTGTTTGNQIGAAGSSTVNLNRLTLSGGGSLSINTPVIAAGTTTVSAGTLRGISNLTISNGSLTGNGTVDMTAGTVRIDRDNVLGGTSPWYFNNLTLGNGSLAGVTVPVSSATTTIRGALTVSTAHFLDAGNSRWNLTGSGTVFIETGSFLEDTSIVQYSGTTTNILRTAYYDLLVDSASNTVTATAPVTGLQVLNNLTIGVVGSSTLNLNTNDPVTSVGGLTYIGSNGTLIGSNSATLQAAGSWDNDGRFIASSGTVQFTRATGTATVAAGVSPFHNLSFTGAGSFTVTEHATTTGTTTISGASTFTLQSGRTLAVGGRFLNNTNGNNTTWTGSTLSLFSPGAWLISARIDGDDYGTVTIASGTQPRLWNSTFSSLTVANNGSLYSMNHNEVVGDLYIFGDYVNNSFVDHWSYAEDFDGTALGSPRQARVFIEGNGGAVYTGGALYVLGTSSASTTIEHQGSGTYLLSIGGTATTSWQHVVPRDLTNAGITFTGTPTVELFNTLDLLVPQDGAAAITVNGTVINQNPARNFNLVGFTPEIGVTSAFNVNYTGSTVSSWRFVNAYGALAGESFDNDSGDPGEIVWDDSAALITVSGRVYSDEGSTVSTVCDGVTNNIVLRIAGLTTASTSCNATTGVYSIPNVTFSPADTLTLYIDGETERGATVTVDPVSNISDMDLYESRVIVRHETSDPIRIVDLAVWDSSDDADIPFTALDSSPDTLSLPADTKLIIWNNKTFAPGGNVTLSGGGSGSALDGTLEAFPGASFQAAGTQSHEVNGSLIFGAGATFAGASSTVTLSSTASGRTIDVNAGAFHNLIVTGSGSFTVTDPTLTVANNFEKSAGSLTLPTGTTTVGGDFENTGGSFANNGGTIVLTATDSGNAVAFGGSVVNALRFTGTGTWTMSDAHATATADVTITRGSVTLPSGSLSVGGSFSNATSSTLLHNNGTLIMTAPSGTSTITQSGDDLNALTIVGAGNFVMTDGSATLRNSLTVVAGALSVPTSTLTIGGSLTATSGTLHTASGTLLFNSTATGRTINPGSNTLYNVVIASASGGWTLSSATTTNNFSLVAANNFTLGSGQTLTVGGVFSNTVGGAATTWTGSTVRLTSNSGFTINTKAAGGDAYNALVLTGDTDVRFWNSSFATTTIAASSSIYSQDHAASDGALRIFGDFRLSTSSEHWSYATDFDGTTLSGGLRRAVSVTFDDAANASFTQTSGTLNIVGAVGATTTITTAGSGFHTMNISGGTFNASYYAFSELVSDGLNFSGTPAISSLSNGSFTLGQNSGRLISLQTATLNANAGLVISTTAFNDGGFSGGVNVWLSATSTNAWTFTNHSGNLDGEDFDTDGTDACGSIRWDDSECLLIEQTQYRWRNDDGGLGVPNSEWFNTAWDKRRQVRVVNPVNQAYATTAVELTITYDTNMQNDFEDLRFTDVTGTTVIPHWIETFTSGVSAQVWVPVASLPARGVTSLYLYYDNVSATTTSTTSFFGAIDTFEDGNLAEYTGDSFYTAGTDNVYGGTFALQTNNGSEGNRAIDGIARFNQTVAQGDRIRYRQYVDTVNGSDNEACTMFGVQSPVTANQNYGVCLTVFGTDRLSLVRNVESTDTFGSVVRLATTSVTYTTGWYEVLVDWQTNNTIAVQLLDPTGTLVASTSATDSTYTSGGYGFTSWGQHGAWDSFLAYDRVDEEPLVYIGNEQTDGGASWNQAQNTPAANVTVGSPLRLRMAVENTGLALTDQEFQLEFAPRGAAPQCEAVDGSTFAEVPTFASCGSSPICMATSSNVTNNESISDLLTGTRVAYVNGQAVEDPSNRTTDIDLDQNTLTEVEYVLTPTINVTDDAYCFRMTENGTPFDSYGVIAELSLEFTPTLGAVSFNNGSPIVLTPGTTTRIYASTTVTDLNGFADLAAATTTFYKSNVPGLADCTADPNTCYRATTTNTCSFTACSGNSCTLSCYADFAYHADPTDADGGVFWYAYVEVRDSTNNGVMGTSPANDVNTLRALSVTDSINYGTVGVNTDSGAFNPVTTLNNLGNEAIDVQVLGTDLTDGGASVIEADEQRFATSTFTYSSCTFCSVLSETGTNVEVDLAKPTSPAPFVSDQLYWGIFVPFGTNSAAHTGINTFIATGE